MSRIGKNPVEIPDGVDVRIDGQTVRAKGRLGELSATLVEEVVPTLEDKLLWVRPRDESKRARTMWGTSRSIVANLVTGVSEGFTVNLEIVGVGYRAQVQGSDLVLQLGYSHEVRYPIDGDLTIKCERPTAISISGADKQKVGQAAAEIRAYRPPEPYKGKGIRYQGEYILRKEGKKK